MSCKLEPVNDKMSWNEIGEEMKIRDDVSLIVNHSRVQSCNGALENLEGVFSKPLFACGI